MAKIFKQLVFGQKKNPPPPPRPDYEGNAQKNAKFADHLYANVGSINCVQESAVFLERQEVEQENKLVVFQEYSEPADLRAEWAALSEEIYDPLYMAPVDQTSELLEGTAGEEEVYCVPYEERPSAPPLPSPCLNTVGSSRVDDWRADSLSLSDGYDTVPDLSHDYPEESSPLGAAAASAPPLPDEEHPPAVDTRPSEEYDEPWEWAVTARLGNSLQSSPSSPGILSLVAKVEEHTYSEPPASPQQAASCESLLSDSESICEEGRPEMTTRQRRLYETAFDSRVKRDMDDIDRLMQSPVLQGDMFRPRINPGQTGPVLRTVSRSSFGSTSGSSTSSTPTHQLVSKPSPRPRHYPLHFTPTERRKVTLIRDHLPVRSSSPMSRPIKVLASVEPLQKFNRNVHHPDNRLISSLERQLSLNNRWDSASRCSDKSSSSQESMDQKEDFAVLPTQTPRLFPLAKSASRDSIAYRDVVLPNRNLNDHIAELSKFRTGATNVTNKNLPETSMPKEDLTGDSPVLITKKPIGGHSGIKVLPTDNGRLIIKAPSKSSPTNTSSSSPSQLLNSKPEMPDIVPATAPTAVDNESRPKPSKPARPCSLIANGHKPDNVIRQAQSPENDDRPSDDYDPPWEFKPRAAGVNWSQSVPESLSRNADIQQQRSSEKDDRLEEPSSGSAESANSSGPSPKPSKPSGPIARPNLNLNLNLNSDSPRKARQNLTLNFGCAALSAVGEKVDAGLTLEKQGWYHGSISRHDAENLLRVLKEGSYLVRNSESSKQDYSLSLKSARGFMHMKIVHSEGRFILGQFSNPFTSIPEMIHHYSLNKLPIKGAEHMSLLYPVIDQLL